MKNYLNEHKVVSALLLLGLAVVFYRLFWGLGAVSALSDSQPWGLIKALNILSGAALAAGSFVVAAAVYVFGMKRLQPVVRPALLMGFIGHTFVLAALLYDVGRPIDVWRIIIDPQLTSVMLLTFACEAVYTTAVIAEVLPEFWKTDNGIVKFLHGAKGPIVVISATVAVIYQSTLGSLYLVSPHRIDALWYTRLLPPMFFISAIAAGLGMVVIEAYLSDRAGRRAFNKEAMKQIGAIMAVVLAIYIVIRVVDIAVRGGFSSMGQSPFAAVWFIAEMCAGLIACLMLLTKGVREKATSLAAASALAALSVVMNRLGVAIVGWENYAGMSYIPSLLEIYASFFFVLAPVAIYAFASKALIGGPKAA